MAENVNLFITLSWLIHTRILNFLKVVLEKVHDVYFLLVLGRTNLTEDRGAPLQKEGCIHLQEDGGGFQSA